MSSSNISINNSDQKDNSSNNIDFFINKEFKSEEIKIIDSNEEPKKESNTNNSNDKAKKEEKRKEKMKKLEEDKDYKRLKEGIDKGINFIDYFLVIGISPENFFDDNMYECDLEELKTKYKEKLEPKIISYFPQFDKSTIAFDDSIIPHCFPNGFNIIKSNKTPKPEIFSFILDNNYVNINYPQKYLSCLICYENINKYKILYDEYKKLDKNENEDEKTGKKRNKSQEKKKGESLSAIDLQSLENQNMSLYVTSNVNLNESIYIPKCIMIMSLHPFFAEYEKILLKLYKYSLKLIQCSSETTPKKVAKSNSEVKRTNKKVMITKPMDKIIENLVIELPAPPRGVINVQYSLITNEENVILQSLMNELPLLEVNLKKIFTSYNLKDIITIYLYLFLESRILFFSKNIEALNIYIYAFLSFLYPFKYEYQIVTILPNINFEILESITPFIAGINESFTDDFFDKRDIMLNDTFLIVDIDEKRIVIINEQEDMPNFPKNHRKTLEDNLKKCLNSFKIKEVNSKNSDKSSSFNNIEEKENDNTPEDLSSNLNEDIIDPTSNAEEENKTGDIDYSKNSNKFNNFNIDYGFNKKVNEIFFDFNSYLLSNYSKYLNLDFYSKDESPSLEVLFKVQEFLNDVPNSDKKFYEQFINETQLFGTFLYMRMIPKDSKESIHILSFDEQINKNFPNKTKRNIFIGSDEYKIISQFNLIKARKITQEEKKFYKDKDNKKELLSYGIMIEEENDNVSFNYPVFPKLTTDFFFPDNFREYSIPNNLNENIDSINEDIISKSHLGGIKKKQSDMINYIYLAWMQMWGMTFGYCDENEKNYWFQELMNIIEKTTSHEMETYNLLFETLSVHGKEDMILELYNLLLKLHLNPSFKVHDIAMKILDKQKNRMERMKKKQMMRSSQKKPKIIYTNKNFRKRTLKSKYCGNILSDDIIVYAFDTCIYCQKNINLETVSLNYKEMSRELMWAKCSCGEYILPKITIQYGSEINKSGKLKINTSKNECVVLFSPYFLKSNYRPLVKKNGIHLDVEELMPKYSVLFWNSLWYFKLYNLEYSFMLPYQQYLDIIIVDTQLSINTLEMENDLGKEQIDNKDNDKEDIFKYNSADLKTETFSIIVGGKNPK